MNKLYIVLISCLIIPCALFGQKRKKNSYSFPAIESVSADGNISEWREHLSNKDSKVWSFATTIIDGKLYTAIEVKDKNLQEEALLKGLFVNIIYNNKGEEGARLVFPALDREKLRALSQDEDLDKSDYKNDLIRSVRGYYIHGFNRLRDGLLSFENEYGIQAFAVVNEEGHLIYESVIPLDLIKFKTNEITVQFGVNVKFGLVKNTTPQVNSRNGRVPVSPRLPKSPYNEDLQAWFSGTINQ